MGSKNKSKASKLQSSRRQGRKAAVQILFSVDLGGESTEMAIQKYWGTLAESTTSRDFTEQLVRGVAGHLEEVDAWIVRFSKNWRLERMPLADRAILRLAAYELLYIDNIPKSVTINEALELAKEFSESEGPPFINGVLDRVAKEIEKP